MALIENEREKRIALSGYDRSTKTIENEGKSQRTKICILDLPSFVLIDIISRLPLKNVSTCRFVCKSWHNMLESFLLEPFFAKRYMLHAPTVLMLRLGSPGIENPKDLCMVNLQNCPPVFPTRLRYTKTSFRLGNSCNGLACLCYVSGDPVWVWNPILGEYKTLPKGSIKSSQYKVASGLGFNPSTNEYKVIRIFKPAVDEHSWQAEIYTLGTDSWRSVGVAPYLLNCQLCGTYFNGALHWLVRGHDSQLICTFDLLSEKFLCHPLPNVKRQCYWSNLGVFDECLYICASDVTVLNPDVEIWVMKNNGLKESWDKTLNIKNPLVEWWNPDRQLQLIKFLSNGELVMFCANECLLYYNCRDRTFKGPYKLPFGANPHLPSFITLQDVTKGDYSKVLNVESK